MAKRKLTQKQEKFCRVYIETGNATDAYRSAYNVGKMSPTTVNTKACQLAKSGNVAERIQQIQQKHQKRHDISIDSLTEKFLKAEKFAYSKGKPAAAVAAITGLAKLHGLMQQKVIGEINHTHLHAEVPKLKEWVAEAFGEREVEHTQVSLPN